jgi:hypothetical protein
LVKTTHAIYVDIDFWPSKSLFWRLHLAKHTRPDALLDPKHAVVIPAFEINKVGVRTSSRAPIGLFTGFESCDPLPLFNMNLLLFLTDFFLLTNILSRTPASSFLVLTTPWF